MAPRADKDALLRFLAVRRKGSSSRSGDGKRLRRRIDVMEHQIDDAAVIATYRATATCLLNQNALHLLVPASHGLSDTPFASPAPLVSAARIEGELSHSVAFALAHLNCASSARGCRATGLTDERNWGNRFAAPHERMFPCESDVLSPARTTVSRAFRGRGPKVGLQTFNLLVSVRFRAPPSARERIQPWRISRSSWLRCSWPSLA